MDYKSGAASGNLVRAKPQQKPPEPLDRVAGAIAMNPRLILSAVHIKAPVRARA
jgi:hypothetical protein